MSSLLKLSNNAIGRLSANISAAATSLTLQPGEGAAFPTITGSEHFPATLIRASDGAVEIVNVTARSSDSLTITRAQESTTALSFLAGDRVEHRLTAGSLTGEIARVEAIADAALPKAGGILTGDLTMGAGKKIIFEGTSDDAFETTIDPGDPTADRTLTLPNDSGTVALTKDVLALSGGTMTGLLKFAEGAGIASAATVNLSTATGNTVHITGTTAITAVTMSDGQVMDVIFDGILTLTHHATSNNLPSAANITTAAGDRARYFYDGTTVYCMQYQRADGTPLAGTTAFASAAENAAGTVENKSVDPLGIREAFNATGSAPVYACRAWVNFNGTGTVAIRASGNVSSITDNGVGSYTINLLTALPDADYAVSGSCGSNSSGASNFFGFNGANTASTYQFSTGNSTGTNVDYSRVTCELFR